LIGIINIADRWLHRAELDQVVILNNWLLSTNLYPATDTIDLTAVMASCRSRWPQHAIWFRSLNTIQHADWLARLAAAGFDLIPTRQVYLFRDIDGNKHKNLRRDFKLLRTMPLIQVNHGDFNDADFTRCERLYAQLYLDKYSRLNPQYTAAFMKTWHNAGLLEFTGFRDSSGHLCAVVGVFGQGPLLTVPIVGYDTTWPQSAGLYRLLMAHVLQMTLERDAELNLSAGAASFKRLRGGQPAIEYSAAFSRHLPLTTQRTLGALRILTTKLGVPIMQRFQL
jgi:hypothetical protein